MPVHYFMGRTAEIATLRRRRRGGRDLRGRHGLGGVGKTSLVQHFVGHRGAGPLRRERVDRRPRSPRRARAASPSASAAGTRIAPPRHRRGGGRVPPRGAATAAACWWSSTTWTRAWPRVRAFPVPALSSRSRLVVTSRIVTLHEDLGRLPARCPRHLGRRHVPGPLPRGRPRPGERRPTPTSTASRAGSAGSRSAVRLIAKQLLRPGNTARSLRGGWSASPWRRSTRPPAAPSARWWPRSSPRWPRLGDGERRVLLALEACAPATRAEVVAAVAGVREEDARWPWRASPSSRSWSGSPTPSSRSACTTWCASSWPRSPAPPRPRPSTTPGPSPDAAAHAAPAACAGPRSRGARGARRGRSPPPPR